MFLCWTFSLRLQDRGSPVSTSTLPLEDFRCRPFKRLSCLIPTHANRAYTDAVVIFVIFICLHRDSDTCSPGRSLQQKFGGENALIGLVCSARPVSTTPRSPSAAPERRAWLWNDDSRRNDFQVSSPERFFFSESTLCLWLITRGEADADFGGVNCEHGRGEERWAFRLRTVPVGVTWWIQTAENCVWCSAKLLFLKILNLISLNLLTAHRCAPPCSADIGGLY